MSVTAMSLTDEPELRSDRKRRDILDAARKRFMVEGYASTGMETVARDATVSTATLYSYFPSKADLFQHVVDDAANAFSQHINEIRVHPGDAIEQLREFAFAYGTFMADPFVRSVFRLVAAERRRFEGVARHFFDRARNDLGGTLIAILKRLQAEGVVRIEKKSWAAGQLMGMIEHPTFVVPMVTGDETRAERTVAQICDDAVETFLARYGVSACAGDLREQARPRPRAVESFTPEL
jgi:AcrR family transcriptional regulator